LIFIGLLNVTWIGLITDVIVTRTSELRIIKNVWERVLYIDESEHTIFFKYEICTLDQHGVIIKSVSFLQQYLTLKKNLSIIDLFHFVRKRRKYAVNGCQ